MKSIIKLSELAIRLESFSNSFLRISIAIVLIWIGSLKFFDYEAEGIVPFVANSPFMYFFYSDPGNYKAHILNEGAVEQTHTRWHTLNNTYAFSYGLGTFLIIMGISLLVKIVNPTVTFIGAGLVIVMSIGTLSFLVTTPENWVADLGGPDHGFPYLSARGRLVVKDIIMLSGAFVVLVDSAKEILRRKPARKYV